MRRPVLTCARLRRLCCCLAATGKPVITAAPAGRVPFRPSPASDRAFMLMQRDKDKLDAKKAREEKEAEEKKKQVVLPVPGKSWAAAFTSKDAAAAPAAKPTPSP